MKISALACAVLLVSALGACKPTSTNSPTDVASSDKQFLIDNCVSEGENLVGCTCSADAADALPAELYAKVVAATKAGEDFTLDMNDEAVMPYFEAGLACFPLMNIGVAMSTCEGSDVPDDLCSCRILQYDDALDEATFGLYVAALKAGTDVSSPPAGLSDEQATNWRSAAAGAATCVAMEDTSEAPPANMPSADDRALLVNKCMAEQTENAMTCGCYTDADARYASPEEFAALVELARYAEDTPEWSAAFNVYQDATELTSSQANIDRNDATSQCFISSNQNLMKNACMSEGGSESYCACMMYDVKDKLSAEAYLALAAVNAGELDGDTVSGEIKAEIAGLEAVDAACRAKHQ